jgi:hypothetical protein
MDRHFASDGTCVVPERIGMEASAGVYYLAGREPAYDYEPVSNKIEKPVRGKKNVNKATE